MRRQIVLALSVLLLLTASGGSALSSAAAAPPPDVLLPDLQSVIPPNELGIVRPAQAGREFRYTHIISNLGQGPLEIRPEYDAITDGAKGFQRFYARRDGQWIMASERPIVGGFLYHAVHGHYHYPLAHFGLYGVAANGAVGAPVTLSPKVGFCIADSVPVDSSLPFAGRFGYSGGLCSDPRSVLGISIGWGDLYDYRDDGQAIDATGVADGTYWFRSIVDPGNYLVEANESNNITDVKVRITGDTVTVLESAHPSSRPPAVSVTAPTPGSTVNGTVALTASATDIDGVTGVQFLLDGQPVGPLDTAAPFTVDWASTGVSNGSHLLSATAINGLGNHGTAEAVPITVSNAIGNGELTLDRTVSVDGRGTVTTAAFGTAGPDELLVAFVSSDGPRGPQTATVSGAGLTWSLAHRTNTRLGTSEVWTARATAMLLDARVTSTQADCCYDQSLTVAAFSGAQGIGATAGWSAASGAPAVGITTTAAGGWPFAVGNDWDAARERVLIAGQEMVHQWVDTAVGDTFWTQSTASPIGAAGTNIILGATAPTQDQWNLTAVEVLPSNAPVPGPAIGNIFAADRTSSSVAITWDTDVPATSQVEFGTTGAYGTVTPNDPALTTQHRVALTGLMPATTYHYRIISSDGSGHTTRIGGLIFTTAAVSTLFCDLTAPIAGASVSGTITVSADASSTASVSGVQFKVDGANLGAEDTVPPYAVSWNTTTVSDGPHVLTAVVRDPTGNQLTSTPRTVTVANTPPPTTTTTTLPPTTATTTTPPPPPAGGLVAAWGFNEGAGSSLADASGNANMGTASGTSWAPAGRFGSALSFNGTNARVNVPDAASLDLTTGMTMEAWVRPAALGTAWRTILMKESTGGLAYALYSAMPASRPSAYVNLGGADLEVRGSAALPLNAWSHVAVTYDGAVVRFYVNGTQVESRNAAGALRVTTGAFRIGGNAVWGEWYQGLIDEVRIYNRALTATQIAADMTRAV